MAIYGDNDVYANSPVAAYSVGTRDGGIISGGTGGHVTTTRGVNFEWVYDPGTPGASPSGFTGQGWFAETPGSPIWWYCSQKGTDLKTILEEFAGGTRTNLNDVFQNWQTYVDALGFQGTDAVQQFQQELGWTCWSNLTGGA